MPHLTSHHLQVHRFGNPNLDRFVNECRKIESDANYQPNVSNQTLMSLVVDKDGNSLYSPKKSALAILPSEIKSPYGKIYEIKIAKKSPLEADDEYPVWHIDDSVVLLVHRPHGNVSFHDTEKAKAGDFNFPLKHLNLNQFLNQESLFPSKSISCNII